ncbi:sensor histidine kinase [Paraburkholderia megapolitana]|uniref:sensor histidine kinase n=1 Tax=Paraburkholderia megapolitana TaxID=420953 RepID=UPI0038B9546C
MSAHTASLQTSVNGSIHHHAFVADEMMELMEHFPKDAPSATQTGSLAADVSVDALRHKNEVLAIVAHELRGPLSSLRLAAYLTRKTLPGRSDIQPMLDVIDRQIVGIARLADDLTDAVHVDHNTLRLMRVPVDVADILIDPLEAAAAAAAVRSQTFTTRVPRGTLRLECDPVRLSQAIGNMLRNAVKFTPAGGAIELDVLVEGAELVIRVRDNGPGISALLLPRIFDLFVQSNRTIGACSGGLGIGLAVVKAIAVSHGGAVSAASSGPGTGSEFTLRLPIVVQHDTACSNA